MFTQLFYDSSVLAEGRIEVDCSKLNWLLRILCLRSVGSVAGITSINHQRYAMIENLIVNHKIKFIMRCSTKSRFIKRDHNKNSK
jgi:hypothetical protein